MLYVFKLNGYNHYKIGIANNVQRRLIEVEKHNSLGVQCIKTYKTLHDKGVETNIHQYFQEKRIKNEWFKLTDYDISEMDNLVFLYNKPNHRIYVRKKKERESYVELAKKVIELYNQNTIGQGKRTDIGKEKSNQKTYVKTENIVAGLLNISSSSVHKLKRLYLENPHILKEIDEGKISSLSEGYSITYLIK